MNNPVNDSVNDPGWSCDYATIRYPNPLKMLRKIYFFASAYWSYVAAIINQATWKTASWLRSWLRNWLWCQLRSWLRSWLRNWSAATASTTASSSSLGNNHHITTRERPESNCTLTSNCIVERLATALTARFNCGDKICGTENKR